MHIYFYCHLFILFYLIFGNASFHLKFSNISNKVQITAMAPDWLNGNDRFFPKDPSFEEHLTSSSATGHNTDIDNACPVLF